MTGATPNSVPLMTVVTGLFNPRDAPGGPPGAVLSAARCGSMKGHLAAPGRRVGRRYQRADAVAAVAASRQ
jgi:hypothetical protein